MTTLIRSWFNEDDGQLWVEYPDSVCDGCHKKVAVTYGVEGAAVSYCETCLKTKRNTVLNNDTALTRGELVEAVKKLSPRIDDEELDKVVEMMVEGIKQDLPTWAEGALEAM